MLSWMLNATAFGLFVGLAALAGERIARDLGRQGRWPWILALVWSAIWPSIILVDHAVLASAQRVMRLPVITAMADAGRLLRTSAWAGGSTAERIILLIWAFASTALALRLANGIIALRRIRADAEVCVLDDSPVLISGSIGPAAIGVRDRMVILPRPVLDLDEPLRRLVLAHEREHCDARDTWLLLAAAVSLVLFPWNAALWWITRRLHLALELDCDARVLAGGANSTRYAQLLLWTTQRSPVVPLTTTLATPPSHLERRILAMRDRSNRPRPIRLGLSTALVVVAGFAACSSQAGDGPVGAGNSRLSQGAAGSGGNTAFANPSTGVPNNSELYEFQVTHQAREIPGTGRLVYPSAMRAQKRNGDVVVQFVVDEHGVPDIQSFKVLTSTDPAFTAAVHDALRSMRYSPATVEGRAVRQVVQVPFAFMLTSN